MTPADPTQPSDAELDAELLREISAGSQAAFRRLFRKHFNAVLRIAYGVLLDVSEAQDVAQDVFVRLHRSCSALRADTNLGAWLRSVTLNESLTVRRRLRSWGRRWISLSARPAGSDHALEVEQSIRGLLPALERLAPSQRAVLALVLQGSTPTEASIALGMSANATRVALHRALTSLREEARSLGLEFPHPDPMHSVEESLI